MIKYILRFVFITMMIFGMAVAANADSSNQAYWTDAVGNRLEQLNLAVGEGSVIRLQAEVPEGKTLKAYSFMVMYDDTVVKAESAVKAVDSVLPPVNINLKDDGSLIANSFDIMGVAGKTAVSLVDINIKGLEQGTSYVSVLFSAFGASADDQFKPATQTFQINVK